MDVIPLQTLFSDQGQATVSPQTRAAIAQADVIVAVDLATQSEFTIYGTPSFEETVTIGHDVALRTLRIEMNERAGELNKLVALVQAIKHRQTL